MPERTACVTFTAIRTKKSGIRVCVFSLDGIT